MVLRQAMEQHYNDLCSFARRLLSEMNEEDDSLVEMGNPGLKEEKCTI